MKDSKAKSNRSNSKLSVKKGKAKKDPNRPKRAPSAFFVFMDEFRKDFKEKNPEVKQVSVVGKAGGVKWRSLSDAEKSPYVNTANKLKSEYNQLIAAYYRKQSAGRCEEPEESDKAKSEVNDEDLVSEEGGEE